MRELKNIDRNKMLKVIDKISKNDEANKLVSKFKNLNDELEGVELICTKFDWTKYDFNHFSLLYKFIEKIYNYEITLNKAIEDQTKFKNLINKVNKYKPKTKNKRREN